MFIFGISIGIKSVFNGNVVNGFKRILYPVGYWRYPIYTIMKKVLNSTKKLSVLDIGSPKIFALYFAIKRGYHVYATDLQDEQIFSVWHKYYSDFFSKKSSKENGLLTTEFQDARKLKYPDEYFDIVYSISVLEHIPENGDTDAMIEIARVLKPGGTAIIEVPYAEKGYDTYLSEDVYDKKYKGQDVFYQRHYDNNTLKSRLLSKIEMVVEKRIVVEEKLPYEMYLDKLPKILQLPFLFFSSAISMMNHKYFQYNGTDIINKVNNNVARSVTIVLEKSCNHVATCPDYLEEY